MRSFRVLKYFGYSISSLPFLIYNSLMGLSLVEEKHEKSYQQNRLLSTNEIAREKRQIWGKYASENVL